MRDTQRRQDRGLWEGPGRGRDWKAPWGPRAERQVLPWDLQERAELKAPPALRWRGPQGSVVCCSLPKGRGSGRLECLRVSSLEATHFLSD